MAVSRISLNRDAKVWTASVYTKNLTPFELYHWLVGRFCLDDEHLLSISVQREQQRCRYPLKRSRSIPCDLNKAVHENPFWLVWTASVLGENLFHLRHTVKVMYRYSGDEAITAETIFRQILGGTLLDQSLSKMEAVDCYEATLR